ncbi:Na+/proline symporter [Hasllibacter halocynthiae]|uniref:Na+/proline symporter n=1 Tax=Hasllibacter halocynthiae TaxID=595589 RepID=A0A2T0X878_9RHOB|nr:sodium:proline symporter [Hasllibacter halocynthiae]PRY95074.1 Na+/proline symporter [Hasllibacter halocynthiae]
MTDTSALVAVLVGATVLLSLLAAPRRADADGFFAGREGGVAPGLWTLTLSQVTTWIFARSLMNAAILGYYYGIMGTLAYAAYYGSFLTGGLIVARLRAEGATSVQDWLSGRFGGAGTGAYNIVIALRLLSEVFANLLVVGLIAAALLPQAEAATVAVVATGLFAFAYAAWGGLSAALRTDVVQMALFGAVLVAATVMLLLSDGFSLEAALTAEGTAGPRQGWVLLAVAALQVFSYPAHDPVMMDRGFLADRRTTSRSFVLAFVISTACIVTFGLFGIQAGIVGGDADLLVAWREMFPPWAYAALLASLLISALSTLDSALASAARLTVEELRLAPRTLAGGRAAMAVFAVAGGALTLWGNQSLFDAVAVSGTASMFLAPVLGVGLLMGRTLPLWSYLVAWAAAMAGAFVYFARGWEAFAFLPDVHKYDLLLGISAGVLVVGFAAALAGARGRSAVPAE